MIFDDLEFEFETQPDNRPTAAAKRRRRFPRWALLVLLAVVLAVVALVAAPPQQLQHLRRMFTGIPPYVKAAFRAWDSDRDGLLRNTELRSALATVEPNASARGRNTDAALAQVMAQYDANRDGGLSEQEFADWTEARAGVNPAFVPPEVMNATLPGGQGGPTAGQGQGQGQAGQGQAGTR